MNENIINEYVIALDLGKYEGKSLGRCKTDAPEDLKKVKVRTKMKELGENEFIEIGENSYNLVYNDKNIVIGEQGEEFVDNFTTTKSSDLHKYVAYVIISRYLKPNTTNNKIKIVLACPISVLSIKGAKEKYKEMIKDDGPIKIQVNGEKYEFEITDIMVKTEDSCVIYTPELSGTDNIGIVGFGGLNMNYLLYNKGEFIFKKSYEHGAVALEKFIKDDLTYFKDGNIPTEYEINMALERGYIMQKGEIIEESKKVVEESKKRFLEAAKIILIKDNQDIDTLEKMCFIGGTTIKLKNQISEMYSNVIKFKDDDDYQMASIVGLYKVAVKKYLKN